MSEGFVCSGLLTAIVDHPVNHRSRLFMAAEEQLNIKFVQNIAGEVRMTLWFSHS
jgi:hypothetical protein